MTREAKTQIPGKNLRRKKSTRDVQWLRRTFALTGDDHEPLYSENGWTNFTTQKGYTTKLKLMSVFVDDQDKP